MGTIPELDPDVTQWQVCISDIEDPDGNPITPGGEVGAVYPLEEDGHVLLGNPTGSGNPGPTYTEVDDCPAICFAPAEDKGGDNELLAVANEPADQLGVAMIFRAPSGPYTLLVPSSTHAAALYWVWDDGTDFNVTNGDGSVGYSTPSPGAGVHLLELVCDETEGASSIRLDGADIEPPGSLWPGVGAVALAMSNVEVDDPTDEWCLLYAAWWSTVEGGPGPPE